MIRGTKYTLDTNLYIYARRQVDVAERISRFHTSHAPFEYLSAIVAQELLAGTRTPRDAAAFRRHIVQRFEEVGRIFSPSPNAWHDSGEVLAAMVRRDGLVLAEASKSFVNDILLALSCRERGIVLITANEKDFARITRFVAGFRFVTSLP